MVSPPLQRGESSLMTHAWAGTHHYGEGAAVMINLHAGGRALPTQEERGIIKAQASNKGALTNIQTSTTDPQLIDHLLQQQPYIIPAS